MERIRALICQGAGVSDSTEVNESNNSRVVNSTSETNNPEGIEILKYQQQLGCKADQRIGKITDWIGINQFSDRFRRNERYGNQCGSANGLHGCECDNGYDDADESTFQLVDNGKPIRSIMQRNARYRMQHIAYRKMQQKEEERRAQMIYDQNEKIKRSIAKEQQKAYKQWQKRGGASRGYQVARDRRWLIRTDKRTPHDPFMPTINIRPNWQLIQQIPFAQLNKLHLPNLPPAQNISGHSYGRLYQYDKSFDKTSVRMERPLKRCGGTFYNITTTEDPIIEQLARDGAGDVFVTDIILATLMTASRSVYSWDVIAYRVGDKLFFDKRDTNDFMNPVDAPTVNETSTNPIPSDDPLSINHPRNLATEALYVNQNFHRIVLKKTEEPLKMDNEAIPFDENDQDSCAAYKYRLWSLGDTTDGKDLRVVCRTEVDGYMLGGNGEVQMLTIKAMSECDPKLCGGIDWRSKLDTQKGAILANELRNNSCKLAKWTLQALLADSDIIKFGYISRKNTRSNAEHVILGTQQSKPIDFANNIALNIDNCWGIVRCIIDLCMKQPAGKYLLIKESNEHVFGLTLALVQCLTVMKKCENRIVMLTIVHMFPNWVHLRMSTRRQIFVQSLSFYALPEGALDSSSDGENRNNESNEETVDDEGV